MVALRMPNDLPLARLAGIAAARPLWTMNLHRSIPKRRTDDWKLSTRVIAPLIDDDRNDISSTSLQRGNVRSSHGPAS